MGGANGWGWYEGLMLRPRRNIKQNGSSTSAFAVAVMKEGEWEVVGL